MHEDICDYTLLIHQLSCSKSSVFLTSPPLWFRLKYVNTTGWIVMKFCPDIHVPQMMNPNEFGDPLTFSTSTTMRLTFLFFSEMSQEVLI